MNTSHGFKVVCLCNHCTGSDLNNEKNVSRSGKGQTFSHYYNKYMGNWESVGQEKDKPPLISLTRIGTDGSFV
jgi:hypothetical protein